ncbi:putative ribonuclease H-like domain-containing protein [Tanacetum coccineum]
MDFVSSPSSTNEVNTDYGVSTANTQIIPTSTQVSTTSTQASTANLNDLEEMDLKWQLALLSMRIRRFFQKTGRKITINGSDTAGYDKSKVECFNCHKLGHFARECRGPRNQDNRSRNQDSSRRTINVEEISSKAMLAIDGAGFDWSFMADEEVPSDMALMAFSDSEVHNDKTCSKTCLKSFETLKTQLDDLRIEFNKSEFNLATYKRGLASVEEQLVFYKKNEVLFCEQLVVLKRDISYKDSEISVLKSELDKLKQDKESNQLKIEKFDNASKSLDKLIGSQIPDKSRKGLGFVSYNVVPPPPTGLFSPPTIDLSNSGLEEFQQPEFEGYGPKISKSVSEDVSNEVRKSPDAPLVEELVSDVDKFEKKTVFPTKIEFVKQQEKPVRKPVKYAKMYRSQGPRGNQRNYNNQKYQQLGSNFVMYNKACFVCGSFDHLQNNCNYHQKERVVSRSNYTRVNYKYSAQKTHPSAQRNMVPRAVLMKNGLITLNTATPVNTAHPKTTIYSARPMSRFYTRTTLTNKNLSQKVNTAKGNFYTDKPKTVNTARPDTTVVNTVRANQGHLQKEDQGYVDSECSRHMTRNMSYLSDFKEFDDDMYTFGGELKEEELLVKELLKLMCDKKNSVLFTDTGCFVLSPDFKLANESQAILDESMLWHKRLGHVNFKTINKLVKDNLVKGDGPKWLFDIDVLTESMNYVPVIAGTNSNDFVDGSLFNSSLKNASNDEPQPSSDAGKKDDESENKLSGINDQEKPKNSSQDVNTTGPSINTASTNITIDSLNINTVSPTVITAPLEAIHADFFRDETELDMSNIYTTYQVPYTLITRIHKDHSLDNVIGNVLSSVQTRRMTMTINEQGFISAVYEGNTHEDLHTYLFACFLSREEPKRIAKSLSDLAWVEAMQEELLQFKLQKVWILIDLPKGKRAIGTKWIFRNKKDKRGILIKNKSRIYGVSDGYEKGKIDQTLFIKKQIGDILLVQVYVNDIIFGSTKKELCTEFEKLMHDKFQMNSIGELTFLLGLQVKQKEDGIFISQDKYVAEILRKFSFTDVRTFSTPMDTDKPLLKDLDGYDVDVHLYRSLMYLTSSRPDIMFAVCACARFQVSPKASHLHDIKRIFRYLKGEPKLGLWYPRDSSFDLVAYSDSDYCKKQTVVATQLKLNMWLLLVDVNKYSGFRIKCWIMANETVIKEWEDRMERAATTASSLEADGPRCQDTILGDAEAQIIFEVASKQSNDPPLSRVNTLGSGEDNGKVKIITEASIRRHLKLEDSDGISTLPTTEIFEQLALMGTPTMPYELPLPRVHTLGSDEGRMQHNELMDLVTKLSDRFVALETDLRQTKKMYGAAYTKLIKKVKKLERAAKSSL